MILKKRSIATSIILTIITCGLYNFYWFAKLNDERLYLSGEDGPSGGWVILLTIVTCGLYGVYWCYQSGKRMFIAQERNGMHGTDNSVLYLVLAILGIMSITEAILQSEINNLIDFIEIKKLNERESYI